jgi:tripartite-type tricarboxylate transporter receptor subunit TctC
MTRALITALLCAGWALHGICAAQAQSQTYPNRPIRMIVPFPAGGPTDGLARVISDRLSSVLGQSIVVENKGGAGGSIGGKVVATSDPDGYTLLITPGGALTTGPAVHKNIGYDVTKAFVPVGLLVESPNIMSVHPGKISWGSQGFGTAPHLLYELFKLEMGVDIVHVPYRGTAPMLAAVVAGEVQMVADPSMTSLPHVQSGRLRALAIAGTERMSKLPDVPSTTELGYPKLQAPFWLGVVAPAGTPPDIITKLNAAFRESLAPPETRARLANIGADIKIDTPAAFGKLLADEFARWTAVAKAANISVD